MDATRCVCFLVFADKCYLREFFFLIKLTTAFEERRPNGTVTLVFLCEQIAPQTLILNLMLVATGGDENSTVCPPLCLMGTSSAVQSVR